MNYFNPEFLKFFKELTKNNSGEWFNNNRATYEKEVKIPFSLFVTEMISRIQKLDPAVKIKASDAIMRINKDIRFSRDKIPYNTYVGAIISPHGRKSKEYPGLYIQLGAEKISVFGGAYMVEKDTLQRIRKYLAKNPDEYIKITGAKSFKDKYGEIRGEKNKILPPEFKGIEQKLPFIANKSFFFSADLSAKEVLSQKLPDLLLDYYKAGKPVNDFLIKAMGK